MRVIVRQAPAQVTMQRHQIEMRLQRVVVLNHLLLHRLLVVVTGSATIGFTSGAPFTDPIALPVENPPTGLPGITKHQIDRTGEKTAAVHRK